MQDGQKQGQNQHTNPKQQVNETENPEAQKPVSHIFKDLTEEHEIQNNNYNHISDAQKQNAEQSSKQVKENEQNIKSVNRKDEVEDENEKFQNQSKAKQEQQIMPVLMENKSQLEKDVNEEKDEGENQEKQEHENSNQFEENQFNFDRKSLQNQQKEHNDEQQFNWGEQQRSEKDKQKQINQLFIDLKMKENQHLLKIVKDTKKKSGQTVDIWKDLRESMVQKQKYQNAQNQFKKKRGHHVKQKSQKRQKRSQSQKNMKVNKSFQNISHKKSRIVLSGLRKKDTKNSDQPNNVQQEDMLKNIENMKKEIAKKIKKWSKQQKQIQKKRQQYIEKKEKQIQKVEKLQKISKMHSQEKEREQRLKRVMERLQKRSIRKGLNRSMDKLPENENKSIIKLKNKSEKHIGLKQYQAQSSQLVKDESPRPEKVQGNTNDSRVQHSAEFLLNLNKDMTKYEKQKIKSQRRKIFNEKLIRIPVNISEEKKLKMLIGIDKSMNPLKYQIMGRKGFTDEEIYHETKQFHLPENPKNIGKRYLQELRSKNRVASLLNSVNNMVDLPKNERNWKPTENKKSILYSNKIGIFNASNGSYRDKGGHNKVNPEIQRIGSKLDLYDEDEFLKVLQK